MARLPAASRESVPEKYRDLFDEVAKERGGAPTGGPGSVTLNSPEVAKRTNHLSAYLRQESGLPAKIQELAPMQCSRANQATPQELTPVKLILERTIVWQQRKSRQRDV